MTARAFCAVLINERMMNMISIITCTNRPHMIDRIFENYTHQWMEKKELILILNNDHMDITYWRKKANNYPHVSIFQLPERLSVSACKNFAVQKATYDYIAKFDDDDYYAPPYLTAAWKAFNHQTKADIVGKSSIYFYFEQAKCLGLFASETENNWTNRVADSTLVFKKAIFQHIRFTNMKVGSDKRFQMDARAKGFLIYSGDRYNHVAIREATNHTWQMKDDALIRLCTEKIYTEDYKAIVTTGV